MKKRTTMIILLLLITIALFTGLIICVNFTKKDRPEPEQVTEKETEIESVHYVPVPDIDEQLLTLNDWSRPGLPTSQISNIVIHYLGNPGTTAQENRDYFEGLKDYQTDYMSANYIVGLDGEIIACVPEGELAYASNDANDYSISIENCHMDESGRFLKKTYISLVHLTAYLLEKYHLTVDDIIRHHDVTGKQCPIFYVEHEEAWEAFKKDVAYYYELSQQADPDALATIEFRLAGISYTYLSKADAVNAMPKATEYQDEYNSYDDYDAADYWYDDYYDDGYYGYDDEYYEEPSWDDYYDEAYYDDPYYGV